MSGDNHLNPPKQSRSRKTLERIVQAALEILGEQGHKALTVQTVVDRADSSVGSFYARFSGKEDLLDYLGERLWDEALERWDSAIRSRNWSEIDLHEIAESSVSLLVEIGVSRAAYLRALDQAQGMNGVAYNRFRDRVLGDVAEILLTCQGEISHPEPDLAVRLGLLAAEGMIQGDQAALGGPVPREVVAGEAANILLHYLTAGSPPRAPVETSEKVDFFDIWS